MSRTYLLWAFVAFVVGVTHAQTAVFSCTKVRDFGVLAGRAPPVISFRCADSVTVGRDKVFDFVVGLNPSSVGLVKVITARVVAGVSAARPLRIRYFVSRSSANGLCNPNDCRKMFEARIN